MTIAIIGTGNIGSGLAQVLSKTSHKVLVVDRNGGNAAAEKLQAEGAQVQGAELSTAAREAEIVVLATPYNASLEVAKGADWDGKVIIDVSNPVTEDFSALQVGHSSSAAESIAAAAPGATVVKAFNTIFAQHYASGLKINGQKLQTYVASDSEEARTKVMQLAEEIGLEARAAGPLSNARYLEPLGYMNIQFGYMLGQGTGIAPNWLAA
ncbi:MAG: F420-dependent NADP oxidoreductase [Desulfuromonas sp.]|nr:MAG: F420-dependent NADP oxidoreductase [Desulfuromonas sp.]